MTVARDSYYPDDLSIAAYCQIEGCIGKGNCSRCGEVNYRLMGYYGAVARWAKKWGITEAAAEFRIEAHHMEKAIKRGEICGSCGWPTGDEFCCQQAGAK